MKTFFRYATMLAALFVLGPLAHAQEKFAAPDAAERVATSPTTGVASMMLSLVIVLGAVFAAAWIMRKLRAGGLGSARGTIEVLADMPLSTKERAVLVRVGREQILLGVAPGRVNTLHVFAEGREPVGPDTTSQGSQSPVPVHPDFKAILRRSVGLR